MSIQRMMTAMAAAALGILPLAACGSDRAGSITAPTAAAAAPNAAAGAGLVHSLDDHGSNHHGDQDGETVEGEGIITGLDSATSCPALTFLVGSKSIAVTDATVFDRGTCADLTIGRRVHVKGTMTGDSIVASRIDVQSQSPGHPVVEGDGRVTSLVTGTSCPALQFKAEEWTVTLDANTVFVNGTCADVAAGRKVGVKGTVTAEHEVLATKIVFKGNDTDESD